MYQSRLQSDIGSYRHVITIKRPPATQDSYGQASGEWIDVTTARASKRSLNLRETYQAGQLSSQATGVIEMRYQPSVTIAAGMRVYLGTEVHEITGVDDVDNRHIKLLLYVTDITNSLRTA